MTSCECLTWACEDMRAMMLGNGHNPRCANFVAGDCAVSLLRELCKGIKAWADEEDGVPDWIWEPYKRAVFITEGKVLADSPLT